jgi:hypothetical protein
MPPDDGGDAVSISEADVLDILQNGEIDAEYGQLRWSSNHAFLVTVSKDGIALPAVYKPRSGERPLWDFPDGSLYQREYAAFLTSHQLGWQIVPPTVVRDWIRGPGTIQFYIDHDPEQHYFTFDDSLKPLLEPMAVFDFLVNNADRKGGHCLLDSQGHIWGIDHGITFHAANKLRTVIWDFAGRPITPSLMSDLADFCDALEDETSSLRQSIQPLLTGAEVRALRRRLQVLLEDGQLPLPGNGPNYPWPPV